MRKQAIISIHAPRAGRDQYNENHHGPAVHNFNPRAPCGARLSLSLHLCHVSLISIHAPRAGRDGQRVRALLRVNAISIHAPRAGRDQAAAPVDVAGLISIHAPRAGRDRRAGRFGGASPEFQSTRPVRGATTRSSKTGFVHEFQSTRPVRGATFASPDCLRISAISIHAPRAGRDRAEPSSWRRPRHFNPRAPCGARLVSSLSRGVALEISIHAPRAGRDIPALLSPLVSDISIHAPRAGRDISCSRPLARLMLFQSTRPVRGATDVNDATAVRNFISIHAPRAGRDRRCLAVLPPSLNFNPRAPCGARRQAFGT